VLLIERVDAQKCPKKGSPVVAISWSRMVALIREVVLNGIEA